MKKTETAVMADNKPAQPEEQEKMPRYKFSIIYYPDSKIWMLKNDFSDESIKLKTCDGQQIEAFLKAQLPPEEQETFPTPVKPVAAVKPPVAPLAPKRALEEVELNLINNQGELLQGFAKMGNIAKIEVKPKVTASTQAMAFDARVMAKSMSDHQTIMLGLVNQQNLVDGRLEIPVYNSQSLKQGMYRFTVEINQVEPAEALSVYYGSQLVMLN